MRLLRLLVPVVLSSAVVLPLTAPSASASSASVAALQRKLQASFAGSTARNAAVVVEVAGIGELYRLRPTTSLPPASTEKLYTGLAALHGLGADTRFTTTVVAPRAQVGKQLPGDLWLVAGGDPWLARADLDKLAAAVAATGVKQITGHLYVDDNRYDHVTRGPGWKSDFVPQDTGPISAFTVDHNGYRKDAAYLADPAKGNLDLFRSLLVKRGITVSTSLGRGRVPAGARVITSHTSGPMSAVVRKIAKDSDNVGAEMLVKELGRAKRGSGSTQQGALAALAVLHTMGVKDGGFVDGSGLSTSDRQTAAGEVSLLKAAERSAEYSSLRTALPIACRDGTLKKRMCGTAAAGRVIAKTGTLDTVHALTGWTTTADGRLVRFSFLMAGFTSGSKANAAMDAAAAALSSADLS